MKKIISVLCLVSAPVFAYDSTLIFTAIIKNASLGVSVAINTRMRESDMIACKRAMQNVHDFMKSESRGICLNSNGEIISRFTCKNPMKFFGSFKSEPCKEY